MDSTQKQPEPFADVFADEAPDMGGAQHVDVPDKPDTSAEIAKTTDEAAGDRGIMSDIAIGIGAGAERAVIGTRESVREIGRQTGMADEAMQAPLTPDLVQPQGIAGKVAADLSHVTLGFFTGKWALKVLGIASSTIAGTAAASAVGTGITADPNAERLSNLLAENEWLQPVFQHLAQDPKDSVLVSKAKAMVEDVATSATAHVIFSGLRLAGLKTWEKVHGKPADPKLVKEVEQEAAAALDTSARLEPSTPAKVLSLNGAKNPAKELYDANPSFVHQGTEDIDISKLNWKQADHAGPMKPTKVESLQNQIKTDSSKIPTPLVERDAEGKMWIMDGRHRVDAAKAEGYDKITGHIYETKETIGAKTAIADAARRTAEITSPNGDLRVTIKGNAAAKLNEAMDRIARQALPTGTLDGKVTGEGFDAVVGGPRKGGVNPDYLNSTREAIAISDELGKSIQPEMKKLVPGYRSEHETMNLATMLGEDQEVFAGKLAVLAGQMHDVDAVATGARSILVRQTQDLAAALRKKVLTGDATEYHSLLERTVAFQSNLSAVSEGLGRGLRSMQIMVGPFRPKDLAEVLKNPKSAANLEKALLAADGDPEKIALTLRYAKMSMAEKIVGAHNEYWMGMGLLSRFATQTINMGATGINTLMQPAAMITGGTFQGFVRRDWNQVRQGFAIYNGLRTALFDSMYMAGRAFKAGESIISPSNSMDDKMKYISALAMNTNPESFGGKIIDLFGNLTRASFRGLTFGDEFFKQLSYRAKLSAQASREAADLVQYGQLHKKDVADYIKGAVDRGFSPEGRALDNNALEYAEKAAFVNDLKGATWNDWASMGEMTAHLAGHPVLRGTLLPFVKTPTNVLRTTFDYTPILGQARKQFKVDIEAGGEKAAMALGKLTLGSGFYAAAAMLAHEGFLTGAPPPPGVAVPNGYKPYSIVLSNGEGGKTYIPYQRLQPFADILGLTYDFMAISGYIPSDKREDIATSMVLALSNSLISKTYLRSLTEFFGMFGGYNSEAKAERFLQNRLASYVPGVYAQFNTDPAIREVRSVIDAVMAKTPGLSNDLPPKRNYLGEVKPVALGMPWSLIVPSQISEGKADPVMDELARLSMSDAEIKFTEPPKTVPLNGQKVDLTTITKNGVSAYDRMLELIGTVKPAGETMTFRKKLDHMFTSDPRYKTGNDGSQMFPGLKPKMVLDAQEKYRRAAFEQMVAEYKTELKIPKHIPVPVVFGYDKANRKLSASGEDTLLKFGQ